MKKSLLAGIAVSALLLAAPQALAGGYKPYVSVFGGAAVLTKNPHFVIDSVHATSDFIMNNPGYIIGGAVGLDWGNQVRTEIELSHGRWGSDHVHYTFDGTQKGTVGESSDLSATYLLGNTWLDLTHGSMITPYVGGGLGIGWARINAYPNNQPINFTASGLAFQLGAGFRFDVSDNVSIDAGYRFKDIVGLDYVSSSSEFTADTSLASHNFQVGVTLKF